MLEYPQYTRPAKLGDSEVPAVLLGGNHAAIASWRRQRSIERTAQRRPDLYARFFPSKSDRKLVAPLNTRSHIALVHHPVVDRTGKIVTTSMTNLDIHDIARSSMTYGLAGYHLITPVTVQREKAEYIAQLWADEIRTPPASGSRADAMALIRTAPSIEDTIAHLTDRHGQAPLVVATSARPESFPGIRHLTPEELMAENALGDQPILILLGTGWGLADPLIPSVSRVLTPIEGASDWNHLSVRSAAAILLDRLFGRRP
jgi:tRNA (guanine37-N1)-methyltransferase